MAKRPRIQYEKHATFVPPPEKYGQHGPHPWLYLRRKLKAAELFVVLLGTRNRFLTAMLLFVAGGLMTLGFAPHYYWGFIFFSLPVFYIQLATSKSFGQACWRGFYFGYGYCMAGTWWISNSLLVDTDKFGWMVPLEVLGLSAVMALWFVLFAALVYLFRARMSNTGFVFLWVLIEYARSYGMFGFPWNLVGYMSLANLPIAQMASLIGTYGLSYCIVLIGLLPAYWLGSAPGQRKFGFTVLAILFVASCNAYGGYRMQTPVETTKTMLRLVQPNIPQSIKGSREGTELAIKELGELTGAALPKGKLPDATIWPETAYPFTLRNAAEQSLPPGVNLLLTGAVRAEGSGHDVRIWNSFAAMDAQGKILATYDKHQLVPFGEFVPLRTVLPLQKITPGNLDFSRGAGPMTLAVKGLPSFSPLICYEGIFPWLTVDKANRPEWLLNVTNDGWYGDSPGPYQHFDMVRMRAIEQGLPLVRVANSGISALIDPYGRIVASLPLNQRGMIDVRLPKALPPSLYEKYLNY